jgi:hypothetical protein
MHRLTSYLLQCIAADREPIPIAVFLMDDVKNSLRFRFREDIDGLSSDVREALESITAELIDQIDQMRPAVLLEHIADRFSNVAFTMEGFALTTNPDRELDRLFRIHCLSD